MDHPLTPITLLPGGVLRDRRVVLDVVGQLLNGVLELLDRDLLLQQFGHLSLHVLAELLVPVLIASDVRVSSSGRNGLLGGSEGTAKVESLAGAVDGAQRLGGLSEDSAALLGEEQAQPFLAALDVLALRGNDERLSAAGEDALERNLVAGQRGRRGDDHVEVRRDRILHLVLEPGADGDEYRFALQPFVLGLDVVQALPTLEQVATIGELVEGLEDLTYGRGLPGV